MTAHTQILDDVSRRQRDDLGRTVKENCVPDDAVLAGADFLSPLLHITEITSSCYCSASVHTHTVMMHTSTTDLRSELRSGAGLKSKGSEEDATIQINRKILCLRDGPLRPK
ncbi:unnamed protein product [Leuciscus chuanchicus]